MPTATDDDDVVSGLGVRVAPQPIRVDRAGPVGGGHDVRRISAAMAGTTVWTSPITA